jgi:hypothetical protein
MARWLGQPAARHTIPEFLAFLAANQPRGHEIQLFPSVSESDN